MRYLMLALILLTLTGCQYSDAPGETMMSDLSFVEDLDALSGARVFFAHQSVGENIIEGLQDLARQHGRELPLWDLESVAADGSSQGLIHSPVGKNQQPVSKCVDFEQLIDQTLAGRIDFALLKFCYIDIDRHTDLDTLFAEYQRAMVGLIARHPEITFVPLTVPLRYSPSGPGVWLRELLGRPNNSKLDNLKRNEFNRRLRETYGEDRLIDIAASESTYADGRRESFRQDGNVYYSLIGDYTSDGGHLNEIGRRWVARDFVRQLARIIRSGS
ncbi:MAG: hypothetical protein ABW095_17175 [Candidatus Thiodiazotropha sp.]